MERIIICILDGSRVIDKLKIKKKDINKKFLDATAKDYGCIVSEEVGQFLNKYI